MDYDCPEEDRLSLTALWGVTFIVPRYYCVCRQDIVTYDLHPCIAQRWMLKYPFYRWLNRGIQKLNNLLKLFGFHLVPIDKVHSLDGCGSSLWWDGDRIWLMTNDASSATLRNNTANGCSWCLAYRMFCCFWFPCVLDLCLWAVSGFSFAKVNFLKIARK